MELRSSSGTWSPYRCQVTADTLSIRALNRATLARQLLLERVTQPPETTIEHLVGMQAQNPLDPYYGLWARQEGFDPHHLGEMVAAGDVIRGQFMRGTIHMLTAADSVRVHPLTAGVLERVFRSTQFAKDLSGLQVDEVLEAAHALLEGKPMSRAELGSALNDLWPHVPPGSLAQAATFLLPIVQMPPRGVWASKGQAVWSLFESVVPYPYGPPLEIEDFVTRYLGAFGPAAVKDMRVWSGLTGLREVFDRMRTRLRVYRGENGVELFDLPDLELPDPETKAPPRLLPEYDNVLLSHQDRSRFFTGEAFPKGWVGNVLVDGFYAGSWRRFESVLELSLTRHGLSDEEGVVAEAERLSRLAWPDQVGDVRVI